MTAIDEADKLVPCPKGHQWHDTVDGQTCAACLATRPAEQISPDFELEVPVSAAEVERATKLLQSQGWSLRPPADDRAPLQIGQVWRSEKLGVRSRTVVDFGPHLAGHGRPMVRFAVQGGEGFPLRMSEMGFRLWARKEEARPVEAAP